MEGGYKPWKTQVIIDNSPSLDSYGKPLPPPPSGYFWERRDDRSWELMSFKSIQTGDDQMKFTLPSVLEHVVMPGDTIQGICLRYRVSAIELRRHNNFSGNNIQFSQALRIPVDHEMPISRQQDTPEVILQRFKNISQEDGNEARYYLEENGGDLARALAAWKEDKDWNDTHFYPNANECSSDLPLDESNHPDASKLSRRGCFRNFMRSQANNVEVVPSAASTESWTIVNDTRPQPLTATTGVEEDSVLLSNIISYDENSDIYVVPATGSWKQLRRESSGSGKITDSILSIFGRKRSTSGNSGLGLDDGKVDSMRQPLIDESSYPTPPSYIRRQIS